MTKLEEDFQTWLRVSGTNHHPAGMDIFDSTVVKNSYTALKKAYEAGHIDGYWSSQNKIQKEKADMFDAILRQIKPEPIKVSFWQKLFTKKHKEGKVL